ncbi:hypothetical protein GGX14DRAFT_602654 [Mycena pura]|uniref:Fungal-type protein kinase domain-containing protein n=1 Tax=Mycena pura TaxID=153505 RepID=A0AAD6YFM2_9AGAR|nr:hypothetical protein GGX14DRAFT_602654 [Mycena pura]
MSMAKSHANHATTTRPAKRPRRNGLSAQPALAIVRDLEGNKRALPRTNSDEESAGPLTKRARSGTEHSSNMHRKSQLVPHEATASSSPSEDDPNASDNGNDEEDEHQDDEDDGDDTDRENGTPGGAPIPGGLNVSSPPLPSALSPLIMPRPRTPVLAALIEPDTTELDWAANETGRRHTPAITSRTPPSSASTEHANERDLAQASSAHASLADVEARLAEDVHAHWSKRVDLIESLFGSLVDINSAADILREFLALSILSVQKETDGELKDVTGKGHEAACAFAAIQANEEVTLPADPYRWKWDLTAGTPETAVALFLNVVAIIAHVAAIRLGKAQDHPLPSLRFVTLPDPRRAVPLSNGSAAQDCCPDVMAFDCSAFCEAPNVDAPAHRFLLLEDSPFQYIRKKFPAVLNFTPLHRSTHGPAIVAFEVWFAEQERRNYLDMTRFCWPEVQLTVEAQFLDLQSAMLQEFVYMRQQRRTQPWMRFLVGLVFTTKFIGVLRADTLGIEQCIFDRSCSRGVLDTVRICLGLAQSTCIHRGQHDAFELSDVKTLAPSYLPAGPSKTAVDSVFVAEDPVVEYTHRTVRFVRLSGDRIHYSPDGTKPDVTYYVHHLIQDNGSFDGRCSRIFCVSRKTKSEGDVTHFVGPYALKLYYADHASDCYKDDLISKARNARVKNVLLPTWEWHYGAVLSMRGIAPDVVDSCKNTNTQAAAVVPNIVSNREEVFAQSDLKRHLVQCSDYEEFGKAFIDFAEGIASLAEQDLVHRDLSIGNVLLSKDTKCPSAFLSEAVASAQGIIGTPVVFQQRELEHRMGGLIHDMDMAGHLYHPPEKAPTEFRSNADLRKKLGIQAAERRTHLTGRKGVRMGTFPFMATGLLVHGPPHRVAYDRQTPTFFPTAWLTRADDKYVIDRGEWNTEAASEHMRLIAHFSVEWRLFCRGSLLYDSDFGVELVGLIMRLYFGVVGCIVPVGYLPEVDEVVVAFTLAGPPDTDGRKAFYVLFYDACSLAQTCLCMHTPGFSSVAEFHANHTDPTMKRTMIKPVAGGEKAILDEYEARGVPVGFY